MVPDVRLIEFYVHRLNKRQRNVVTLVADGLSNAAVGKRLYIAPCTVADHLSNIYGELGCLDECAHIQPNRLLLIRLFAPFFDRHPEYRADRH